MNPIEFLRPEIRTLKPYTIEATSARIKMDANESPFYPPKEILEQVTRELGQVQMNRYPDAAAKVLKERISQTLQIDTDQLMLGNGSDELIIYLITTFTGRGNGVLFPSPTFSMYGILAKALGQPAISVPLDHRFQIDSGTFLKTVQERSPQMIFLASPNNPTGNRFPEKVLCDILEKSGAVVVVDEAYIDFSDRRGFLEKVPKYPNLIVLRTLSKIGMAALRIGCVISRSEVVAELEKVRLPYNINSLSQAAAAVMLGHSEVLQQQIRKIVEERERLYKAMSGIPNLEAFPTQANFILFRTPSAEALYQSLLKGGILIRNLNQPGPLQDCLRVTVGNPEENQEFLEHVKKFFRS